MIKYFKLELLTLCLYSVMTSMNYVTIFQFINDTHAEGTEDQQLDSERQKFQGAT
jgi:hypothetical protein